MSGEFNNHEQKNPQTELDEWDLEGASMVHDILRRRERQERKLAEMSILDAQIMAGEKSPSEAYTDPDSKGDFVATQEAIIQRRQRELSEFIEQQDEAA